MIGTRIGKYRLIGLLGEGGMGVVYEAVRDDIEVRAAIKVLRAEFASNPEVAGRFFNEARAANLIAHPGIVKVFDYGHEPGGVAYLAMELLEGESLWKRIERTGKMAKADVLRLGRQVASALSAAHEKGIVHREVRMIDSNQLTFSRKSTQRRRSEHEHSQRSETSHLPLSQVRR